MFSGLRIGEAMGRDSVSGSSYYGLFQKKGQNKRHESSRAVLVVRVYGYRGGNSVLIIIFHLSSELNS